MHQGPCPPEVATRKMLSKDGKCVPRRVGGKEWNLFMLESATHITKSRVRSSVSSTSPVELTSLRRAAVGTPPRSGLERGVKDGSLTTCRPPTRRRGPAVSPLAARELLLAGLRPLVAARAFHGRPDHSSRRLGSTRLFAPPSAARMPPVFTSAGPCKGGAPAPVVNTWPPAARIPPHWGRARRPAPHPRSLAHVTLLSLRLRLHMDRRWEEVREWYETGWRSSLHVELVCLCVPLG